MKHAGLDSYAADATFTKHHISGGLQLHLVVGRTGDNKTQYLALSLELAETNASYAYLANNLQIMGFQDVLNIPTGPIKRKASVRVDGFKGSKKLTDILRNWHRGYCGKHVASWVRLAMKTLKQQGIHETNFHDNQVLQICGATT